MKTRKRKINVRLLRRVRLAILKHPRQFVMWAMFYPETESGAKAGGCGTAACIAGWTLHLTGGKETIADTKRSNGIGGIRRAGRLLGVPLRVQHCDNIHPLFFTEQWPEKFKRRWDQTTNPRTQARIAADRIEAFIREEAAAR